MPPSFYVYKKSLDIWFGNGSYTSPTPYVGVSTANPSQDNSTIAEPSGNSYARVNTGGDWNAAVLSTSTVTNSTAITFPQASGSWGTITYIVILDASSSGNQLMAGALSTSKTIGTNDTLSFATSQVSCVLS